MKIALRLLPCVLGFVLPCPPTAWAGPDREKQGPLSPYFIVENADPSLDRLPLKDTRVDIKVLGVIADVTVRQVYQNHGERPIHARYVFPASTRAAVYAMSMIVGDRRVVARIQEREQAKQQFDAGRKREGKSASLLEQSRPNVFSMNVANILPGDTISVELRYTELLVPTDGMYELVYPTVVGPRYSSKSKEDGRRRRPVRGKSPYTARRASRRGASSHLDGELSHGGARAGVRVPVPPPRAAPRRPEPPEPDPRRVRALLAATATSSSATASPGTR